MTGHVRTKERCPVCRSKFRHIERLGFYCEKDKEIAHTFYFDFFYQKKRIQIHRNKNGKKIRSYQDALDLQFQINRELDEGRFDISKYSRAEMAQFFTCNLLDRFFASREYAPSDLKDYKRFLSRAKDFFGEYDAREIRKINLADYMASLEKQGIHGKTLKNYLDFVKTFLRWCCHDLEVLSEVPHFPQVEYKTKAISWLGRSDQVALFSHVPDRDRPIISFLILAGCRPSEARALKIRDVNLENESITIRATFSGREYREIRKGRGAQDFTIPIHPEIMGYVEARVKESLPGAWLFHRNGNHYSENALRRTWAAMKAKENISGIRLYDATRHSFASQLLNEGVDILQISRLLGHSDIRTTQKYAHSALGSLRQDILKLSLHKVENVRFRAETLKKAQNDQ